MKGIKEFDCTLTVFVTDMFVQSTVFHAWSGDGEHFVFPVLRTSDEFRAGSYDQMNGDLNHLRRHIIPIFF